MITTTKLNIVLDIGKTNVKLIFVDTKNNDSNIVYIADMLCEGEIGGIYDVYIDGVPSVCFNKEDFDELIIYCIVFVLHFKIY